jgi:hypothetical protein
MYVSVVCISVCGVCACGERAGVCLQSFVRKVYVYIDRKCIRVCVQCVYVGVS